MRSAWLRSAVIGFCLVSGTNAALSAPQTFNTALPIAEGEFVTRQQGIYKSASDDPSAAHRDVDVFGIISVLGYGISGDLSVFGVLPVFHKEMDVTLPGGMRVTRKTSGIGDARIFSRYTIYREDLPGKTFRIAPFAGLKLPTGDSNDSDAFGMLPAPFRLGSGSWDPFAGVVVTYQTLDFQIDAQASYKVNTHANGFEFGDETRLDASLQYRLWPRELTGGVPGFLYGVLESNLVHKEKSRMGGARVASSGGTSLFVAPGLQYVTQRWIAEAIVQLPVFQDLNGTALRDDFTVRAGFRFNF